MSTRPSYSGDQCRQLLETARGSIRQGLDSGPPLVVDPEQFAALLREHRATFVTLMLANQLRGCVGVLTARQPLISDVADNAYSAAFRDRRFSPLRRDEEPKLALKISILSPPEPIAFTSEAELLAQIQPGVDGLILEEGPHRGTFLPAVWETLPDSTQFLRHLKRKAGLEEHYWSDGLRVQRYRAEEIAE